jgi:hypothetical protein
MIVVLFGLDVYSRPHNSVWIEHLFPKQKVRGSSPLGGTGAFERVKMVVFLPVGTPVGSIEDPGKEIGKIIAHRPIRIEGQTVMHMYAVQVNSTGSIFLFFDNEVSSVTKNKNIVS